MANFVLVHGAWHGGWCWRYVARVLTHGGHAVYAPSLTGLGDRAHLVSPSVDLDVHVRDIGNLLRFEDLNDVILVGHSYGGIILTGVADTEMARIKHLVYLDAMVPEVGESDMDLQGPEGAETIYRAAASAGWGWLIPPWTARQLGVVDKQQARWVESHLVPHPLRTFETPYTGSLKARSIDSTYIYCSDPASGFFDVSATRARAAGWGFHELRTGHDAMVTAPLDVADILLALAPSPHHQEG